MSASSTEFDVEQAELGWLAKVCGMPQCNLAVEMLRKLLAGENKAHGRRDVVQAHAMELAPEQAEVLCRA